MKINTQNQFLGLKTSSRQTQNKMRIQIIIIVKLVYKQLRIYNRLLLALLLRFSVGLRVKVLIRVFGMSAAMKQNGNLIDSWGLKGERAMEKAKVIKPFPFSAYIMTQSFKK